MSYNWCWNSIQGTSNYVHKLWVPLKVLHVTKISQRVPGSHLCLHLIEGPGAWMGLIIVGTICILSLENTWRLPSIWIFQAMFLPVWQHVTSLPVWDCSRRGGAASGQDTGGFVSFSEGGRSCLGKTKHLWCFYRGAGLKSPGLSSFLSVCLWGRDWFTSDCLVWSDVEMAPQTTAWAP